MTGTIFPRMDQLTQTPLEYGVEPETKARRWGKRVARIVWRCIWIGAILAILAHTTWLLIANYRLEKAVQALADAGEPVTITQLMPAEIADNGYTDLEAAMTIVAKATAAGQKVDEMPAKFRLPLLPIERRRLGAYVGERGDAFSAIDRAATQKDTVTTLRPTTLIPFGPIPGIGRLRETANLVKWSALLEFEQGRHDVAFHRIATFEPIGRGAATHPMLIGTLVGAGIRVMEADAVLEVAPDLKIAPNTPGAVSPDAVRKEIARLLDASTIDREFLDAYRGERIFQQEGMQLWDQQGQVALIGSTSPGMSKSTPAPLRYLVRPYVRTNQLACLQATNALIPVLGEPNWPQASAKLRAIPRPTGRLTMVASLLLTSLDRPIEHRYRVEADRRLAATALAVRLYQVDHNGKLPPSLDALVPTYLSAVPLDPMSDGGTLRAKFDDNKPRLWSVGTNARDDLGDPMTGLGTVPRDEWNANDRVVHLVRMPRVICEDDQLVLDELIANENGTADK